MRALILQLQPSNDFVVTMDDDSMKVSYTKALENISLLVAEAITTAQQ
jgi:hypothetical protein